MKNINRSVFRILVGWLVALWFLGLSGAHGRSGSWTDPAETERLHETLRQLVPTGSRRPGSSANLELEEKVAAKFAESGFEHGRIRFTAPHFRPGKTVVKAGDEEYEVHPMHPSLFRPGNFREDRFSSEIIYAGYGRTEDLVSLQGQPLHGRIVMLEFNSGRNWERFLRFGVKGVFFVEPDTDDYGRYESYDKVHSSEVSVPRFFVPRSTASTFKAMMDREGGQALEVEVAAEPSRWENRQLGNPWVFIPGSDPGLRDEIALLVAPLDANSVVPGRAEGAQNAVNLLLLMELFEQFRDQPPARSVLLAAVNGRTYSYHGDRVLAWYLLQDQIRLEEVRNNLAREMRYQDLINRYYQRLRFTPDAQADDEQFLIDLRTLTDRSIGRLVTVKDPIVSLCQRDVNDVRSRQMALRREEERLQRLVESDDPRQVEQAQQRIAEIEQERGQLEQEYDHYVNVLTLFNRVGIRTQLSDLNPREVEILKGYVSALLAETSESAELNRRDLAISADNAVIREVIAGRNVTFAVSLEMVWNRRRIGFSSALPLGESVWAHRWGRNTQALAAGLEEVASGDRENLLFDTLSQLGGLPEHHYLPSRSDTPLVYQSYGGLPAFSLNTLLATSYRAFSPADCFRQIDLGLVSEINGFIQALMPRILADSELTMTAQLPLAPNHPGRRRAWSLLVKTFKYDEFSAAVMPEVPVPNSAVVLATTSPQAGHRSGFSGGDIIDRYLVLTDRRGAAPVYGINHSGLASGVFSYDDDFRRIDHVIDAGESQSRIDTNITFSDSRILSVVFSPSEITVWNRFDPSRVGSSGITVNTFLPLSVGRDAAPRSYGITGAECGFSDKNPPAYQWGPVSFFITPGERLMLATEHKRVALNITDLAPDGSGFAVGGELDSDFFRQSVQDLRLLNRQRYEGFHGVTDGLVESYQERGSRYADLMEEAARESAHLSYLQSQYESLGALSKGRSRISDITNDMLTAVIFFLALLLPFSFFLQKLLFKPVRIEAQLSLFAIIFIGCFMLFRFIHPAFRIAEAPEAMLIAFVMGGLAVFVIYILHSRFKGEMKLLFSYLAADTSEVGYSMVGQQAMMIGVGNMKRRRIRTALTTATIVLVTFTMLAFTSISRTMRPTLIQTSDLAPYTGLMYHWPGGVRMDEASWRVFDEFFADFETVTRRWLLPEISGVQRSPLAVKTEDGGLARVDGILGLSRGEDDFLAPMPILSGRFFEDDNGDEVIISARLADHLRIEADDVGSATLTVMDRLLTVVGIVDDESLRQIRDLNGLSILPIAETIEVDAVEVDEDRIATDEIVDAGGVFHVPPASLLLVPLETSRRLGAAPYSISIRFSEEKNQHLWVELDRLLTATRARFFIASRQPFVLGDHDERENRPGIYYVGAGYRTSIGGLAMLIIPLLIASTIILNTMLGSVFERKREIAIFNAVGLNPTHIGTFFLAESLVYGIIGSVGGYLVGQVLSIALNYYGWITDVNLNFSSLSVAYVIVFTIVIVLLSTLYPAIVATKEAVPSGKRKWSMPDHDGVNMQVVFPFIYQPKLTTGIMHYLIEYLDQFTDKSFGDMIATPTGRRQFEAAGHPAYAVDYEIALPPFDLGVTQKATFATAYSAAVGAYQVKLTITRQSGQDSNWVFTNKPFLERLRKLLLNWRNLKPAEHDIHVQRGSHLFSEDRG